MTSLRGKTIVVTRPEDQSEGLVVRLKEAGAAVILAPTISISTRALAEDESARLKKLAVGGYDWAVFSSGNGPKHLARLGGQAALSQSTRIAAQGQGTAKSVLLNLGRAADFVPSASVSENFASELSTIIERDKSVLIVGAKETRGAVRAGLLDSGHRVEELAVYETAPSALSPEIVSAIRAAEALTIVFYSPSALRAFAEEMERASLGGLLSRAKLAAIGPVTAQAVLARGLKVSAEAEEQSDESLIRALSLMAD